MNLCNQSAEMDYALKLQFHMPFYTLRHFNISEIRAPWLFFGFLQEFQRINDFEVEEQSVSPWYYFYPQTSPFWTDVCWFVHAGHCWFSPPLSTSSLNLYPIFVTSRYNKNIWKLCSLWSYLRRLWPGTLCRYSYFQPDARN